MTIDSPAAGALLVGPNATISVNGTANLKINGRIDNSQIKGVNVRLGARGSSS